MDDTPTTLTLKDGAAVLIRPIRTTDVAAHRRFVGGLSAGARYDRFLHAVSGLTDAATQRFVDVDGVHRFALVAIDPQAPDELIAIARYDRELDPSRAETAIVVNDAWQGRGLGKGLLQQLVDHAIRNGVTTIVAHILVENARSLALFRGLGLKEHSRIRGGVVEMELTPS